MIKLFLKITNPYILEIINHETPLIPNNRKGRRMQAKLNKNK